MNYQKALKKLTIFFLSNQVPFNGHSYEKSKGPATSKQSLFGLQKFHLQNHASQFMTS